MKTHHPTTHHRKRRAHDEAATPIGEHIEAPAQSLASLRQPQIGGAKRARAALGMQRVVGNAAVGRELTHVQHKPHLGQMKAADQRTAVAPQDTTNVQRGFFSKLWNGVKSVGKAVGEGVKSVGKAIGKGVAWAAEGIAKGAVWIAKKAVGLSRDLVMLVFNLLRDLPARLYRLGKTLIDGLVGVVTFLPEAIAALARGGLSGLSSWLIEKAKNGAAWVGTLIARVFDTLGGPEAAELLLHLLAGSTTPLSGPEVGAASSVLGPGAVRWSDVRVNEGGLYSLIFLLNKQRAFTTFHTLNIPAGQRGSLALMVHELTHVYQYEQVGSLYLGQAIHAQITAGYSYGGSAGLQKAWKAGQHLKDFNREQQAQIAEDYYKDGRPHAYDPFVQELQAGSL